MLVVIPVAAFSDVAWRELPVVIREVQATEEALALFLLREVEQDLEHPYSVLGQVVLPGVDLGEPTFPDVLSGGLVRQVLGFQELGVNPYDQHLFVVRPVENADLAAGGEQSLVAPEVVVPKLLTRWLLETADAYPLRVHAAHDVTDGAVFAGRIEPLQAQEQAVGILRGQALLVLSQELHALRTQFRAVRFLNKVRREARVEVLRQLHLGAGLYQQGAGELTDPWRRLYVILAHAYDDESEIRELVVYPRRVVDQEENRFEHVAT